jgi:hypothetical protein
MTHKKKEYQEPSLDVIKLRMPKLLDESEPAGEATGGARRYDFDE